jgi:hypothetical protein
MSLAFDFELRPGSAVPAWIAACHAIGAAGSLAVFAQHFGPGAALGAAAPVLGAGLWSLRRALRGLPRGRLSVDAAGNATWHPLDAAGDARWQPVGAAGARAFEPRRWIVAGGLVWVAGQCGGRALHLLSGSGRPGDPASVRLRAWLRWLDRGGVGRPVGAVR